MAAPAKKNYEVVQEFDVNQIEVAATRSFCSSAFACEDDPEGIRWKLKLEFGGVKKDWLSFFLCNCSDQEVMVTRKTLTLSLANGDVVKTLTDATLRRHGTDNDQQRQQGFTEFLPLTQIPPTQGYESRLKASCKFTYRGKAIPKPVDKDLASDYLRLLESGVDADVVFFFKDDRLPAHKLVLKARSTHFGKMFEADGAKAEVFVDGVDARTFKEMLKYLYSGTVPHYFKEIALKLLPLAHEYGIESLKSACEAQLLKTLKKEDVLCTAIAASELRCSDLKLACGKMIDENIVELKKTPKWNDFIKRPDVLKDYNFYS